uniref:Tubby C-terminal domain-containing protein n=1 Tax=Zooxanthella nutricula TaxID=1333877 RepID=A0A7S2K3M7_9DINO
MPVAQVSKEEEEQRRRSLAQELSNRGICPEYDPVGSGDQRSAFDVSSVAPADMRAFLHSPAPKHAGVVQCRIIRDRSGISTKLHPKYTMESDDKIFLMTAQKQVKNKTSNYAISMSKSGSSKDPEGFLGKLRSDFLGIEWCAYSPGLNPAKIDPKMPTAHQLQQVREELMAVQYTASKWGATAKGPRKMSVAIPSVTPGGERLVCRTMTPQADGLLALQKGPSSNPTQQITTYTNKPPKWNDQIGAYVLNFNKRVTEASVKNFQLISSTDPETVYLQFGRVGKEVFNLDFRHPISPFQAFAMCLSSFDYKLGCE